MEEEYEIPETSETSSIVIEHRFNYNGPKIADVAYIDANEIVCIFEICYTHKTDSSNRPEPWFEISALHMADLSNEVGSVTLTCIRSKKCDKCITLMAELVPEKKPSKWVWNYRDQRMVKRRKKKKIKRDMADVWDEELMALKERGKIYDREKEQC